MSLPVYLKVHNVSPRPLQNPHYYADGKQTTAEMILHRTWAAERTNRRLTGRILQSSFNCKEPTAHLPQRNGLIGTVMDAYANHHHSILRPDDIWIAIITQLNFYVKANSDRLRSQFVTHKGKRRLYIGDPEGKFDFALISKAMTAVIHNNVVDKDLKDWILPAFSTTTDSDTIVSAAIMMATFKNYFSYESGITCGIPSITLEGTQKDWLDIQHRLDKLEDFGIEPAAWAALLRPVLAQFVAAFDGESDIAFWKRIVNLKALCGADSISGWIALFGVWADTGRWAGPRLPGPGADLAAWAHSATFSLSLYSLPVGFCDVELVLLDDLARYPCVIVAGHVANAAEGVTHDTVRPQPGWFMVLKAANGVQVPGLDRFRRYLEMARIKKTSGAAKGPGKPSGLFCLKGSCFGVIHDLVSE